MVRLQSAVGLVAALGVASGVASAQAINLRIETAASAVFTPLHSYAVGEVDGDALFFCGISGMGLHGTLQNGSQVGFPINTFNTQVHLFDIDSGQLYSGSTAHLSAPVREALLVTNPSALQDGHALYVFGGYGPTLAGDNWTTRTTQVRIDLDAVRAAILASTPIPESAFQLTSDTESQLTGGKAIDMGTKFALIGGAIFTGDYGRAATPNFTEQYKIQVHVFDKADKLNPTLTFGQTAPVPSQDRLRRRDMNAAPAMLPAIAPGPSRGPGFVILGGVFRQAAFAWQNPLSLRGDQATIVDHTPFKQNMNLYEGPTASFYSATNDQNRFVLFSGLSGATWDGSAFIPLVNGTLFNIPWTSEITELTMTAGAFASDAEQVKGVMPNPMSNGELVYNERIPRLDNGQVDLDQMPPAEVLLGRIFGGLRAAAPGVAPATFASSTVNNVYVVVGVRGDVNRDGVVNAGDLAELLGNWGTSTPRNDLNLDGVVNAADLSSLLGSWGNNTPG